MMTKIFFAFLLSTLVCVNAVNECTICHKIAQYVDSIKGIPYEQAKTKTESTFKQYANDAQEFLQLLVRYNFGKIYADANDPAPGMHIGTTCADMGFCDVSGEFKPSFKIVDYLHYDMEKDTTLTNIRDRSIIVVHHTVTKTLQETVTVLLARKLSVQYILDVDGTAYRMVNDYYRAWHAGTGWWRGDGCVDPKSSDTNGRSVGIEVVNTGETALPKAQVEGLQKLISYLKTKWHVAPQNIIAHHENSASYKVDINGYYDWKTLYDSLGAFKNVWKTSLTKKEMEEVVLNWDSKKENLLKEIQEKLYKYGYGDSHVGDPYDSTKGKLTTAQAIESFNRKWCPEIFEKEKIVDGKLVTYRKNEQVYKLTVERLNKLLEHVKPQRCTNY